MNKIILEKIIRINNTITYNYSIDGEWSKYFTKKRNYSIEYNENIEVVPESIACIQFILNIIPLVWLFDATLFIDKIDENFLSSLNDIKKGYQEMYPKLNFQGKLEYNLLEKNEYNINDKVGAFFSGGLDATSTLASHYEEKPILINLQGSDISLSFKKVIKDVQNYLTNVANEFELPIIFVKSQFRSVINEKMINKFTFEVVNDSYWHGFQHGIAIIGHAAPISYIHGLKTVYIASSYTKDNHVPCASDPTIDNYVKLSKTNIFHDGYEFDRAAKSENVIKFINRTGKKVNIRVCLDDYRSENCCHCEKCYRTILNFAAKGYDPNKVGFKIDTAGYKKLENDMKRKLVLSGACIPIWEQIQKDFINNSKYKNDERFSWIYNADFRNINNQNKISKEVYRICHGIKKRIDKIFKLI